VKEIVRGVVPAHVPETAQVPARAHIIIAHVEVPAARDARPGVQEHVPIIILIIAALVVPVVVILGVHLSAILSDASYVVMVHVVLMIVVVVVVVVGIAQVNVRQCVVVVVRIIVVAIKI
jgi:hypothetical protein